MKNLKDKISKEQARVYFDSLLKQKKVNEKILELYENFDEAYEQLRKEGYKATSIGHNLTLECKINGDPFAYDENLVHLIFKNSDYFPKTKYLRNLENSPNNLWILTEKRK